MAPLPPINSTLHPKVRERERWHKLIDLELLEKWASQSPKVESRQKPRKRGIGILRQCHTPQRECDYRACSGADRKVYVNCEIVF